MKKTFSGPYCGVDRSSLLLMIMGMVFSIQLLTNFAFAIESNKPKPTTSYFTPENPCQKSEIWNFGKNVPASWKVRYTKPFADEKAWLEYLFLSHTLKTAAKSEEMKALGHYWMGRIYFNLKIYHLAYEQFVDTLGKTENIVSTRGSKAAALECINIIEKQYGAFQLDSGSLNDIMSFYSPDLSKSTLHTMNEILSRNARKRLAKMDKDPITDKIIDRLPPKSSYTAVLQIVKNSMQGNDLETIQYADQFFKNLSNADSQKIHSDMVWLMQGQSYYNLGKYQQANQSFKKVSNNSNYFIQALIGQAWSHLMLMEYNDTSSKAYNFFSGPLKKTFAPDANAVVAIAFAETCNYPEAIESLDIFKRGYSKSHRWLYNWQQAQKSKPQNMYKMIADFLNKKKNIPDKIGNELARSPIFISSQEELNIIEDELNVLKTSLPKIQKKASGQKEKLYKLAAKDIAEVFAEQEKYISNRVPLILKRINLDLTQRAQILVKTLAENLDNAKRIEAEVYAQLGDKMIVEQAIHQTGTQGKVEKKVSAKKQDETSWDWGRFPSQAFDENEDQVEIWLDEVGYFKTDITNRCIQSK